MTMKSVFLPIVLAFFGTSTVLADCSVNVGKLQKNVKHLTGEIGRLIKDMPGKEHALKIAQYELKLQETIAKAVSKNKQQIKLVKKIENKRDGLHAELKELVDWVKQAKWKEKIAETERDLQAQVINQNIVERTGIEKILERQAALEYVQKPGSIESFLSYNWNKYGTSIKYTAVALGVAYCVYTLYKKYMNTKDEKPALVPVAS